MGNQLTRWTNIILAYMAGIFHMTVKFVIQEYHQKHWIAWNIVKRVKKSYHLEYDLFFFQNIIKGRIQKMVLKSLSGIWSSLNKLHFLLQRRFYDCIFLCCTKWSWSNWIRFFAWLKFSWTLAKYLESQDWWSSRHSVVVVGPKSLSIHSGEII